MFKLNECNTSENKKIFYVTPYVTNIKNSAFLKSRVNEISNLDD